MDGKRERAWVWRAEKQYLIRSDSIIGLVVGGCGVMLGGGGDGGFPQKTGRGCEKLFFLRFS